LNGWAALALSLAWHGVLIWLAAPRLLRLARGARRRVPAVDPGPAVRALRERVTGRDS
jgi:hypothetical protein